MVAPNVSSPDNLISLKKYMDNTCSICLEDIQSDSPTHSTMCQPIPHRFHHNCWNQWERALIRRIRCAYCNQPQRRLPLAPRCYQPPIIHIDAENMDENQVNNFIRELLELGAQRIALNRPAAGRDLGARLAYCPDRNMFICHTDGINCSDQILKSLVSGDQVTTRRLYHAREIRQFDNKIIMIGPLPEVWQTDGSMIRKIITVSPEQAITLTEEHLDVQRTI